MLEALALSLGLCDTCRYFCDNSKPYPSTWRAICYEYKPSFLSQRPPVKRVAWISPKMGERQRRRHVSASSGSEPRAEHAVCRTIKPIPERGHRYPCLQNGPIMPLQYPDVPPYPPVFFLWSYRYQARYAFYQYGRSFCGHV